MTALSNTLFASRIALHVARGFVKLLVALPSWTPEQRSREVQLWSSRALEIFGLRPHVIRAEMKHSGPVLLAANHTSWLDVLLIQTQIDAAFVAKAEVRAWPIFGWMAGRIGTVFVTRRRSQDILGNSAALTKQLISGGSVSLFPEGTTTNGAEVLPFKAAMFQTAIDAGVPVQPVYIRYLRRDGSSASETAFTGDMTLLQSFSALKRLRDARAEITFLKPISVEGLSRKEIALAAETAIRCALRATEAKFVLAAA